MQTESQTVDPYKNLPKGLNDEDLWKEVIKRIDTIDKTRRSIRKQITEMDQKTELTQIDQLKHSSEQLAMERAALHQEMAIIKQRIKKFRRERNGMIPHSLAIEFMLIAKKRLPESAFNDIRNQAAINIAKHKA